MSEHNGQPVQNTDASASYHPITIQPGGYDNQAVNYGRSQTPIQVQQGYGGSETITTAPAPQSLNYSMTNVPRGLEYLTSVDKLFVRQKVEMLEAIIGFETKNKYYIFDSAGRQIFYAKEDTDCCTRNLLGKLRPFDMKIQDGYGYEVIHLVRPFACGSCCYPCCLQSIEVQAPPGNVVGTVEQEWSLIIPQYKVKDASGNVVLRIEGPCCTVSCCGDVEFQILSADGAIEVGKISKQWSGLARELFTDADNFGLSFPIDLDVKMKAVMLGACMLIDFMFFETSE